MDNNGHYFNFCTLQTPLDAVHPVAGNRQFGMYSYQENQNASGSTKHVLYISGTDRISDEEFNSLTYICSDQKQSYL